MKRRSFFKAAGLASIPATVDGMNLTSLSPVSMLGKLAAMATNTDHVLVIVELNGGNDGLNTVIPIDQYSNLSKARNNVLIPENKILSLTGYSGTGLHPSLSGMRGLFNEGKLQIIQSVGYPNQNFSHFRSSDIWFTASDHNQYLNSGLAGRYLNMEYPGFPTGYPNTGMPDPLGIQVGSLLSVLFQGPSAQMGIAISDPDNVFNISAGISDPAPVGYPGMQLDYVKTVADQTSAYTKVVSNAAKKITAQATYPNTGLAKQLKTVAKLIAGGLKTRIYMVSIGGFDTHSNQTDKADTTTGSHANLLKTLNDAIVAFQTDLKGLGIADRVLGMTVSEFGRRIKSNDSQGTDHGAAAPMFLFGNTVDGGKILGLNPNIPASVTVNDNLTVQHDFRSTYATVLRDWFCLSNADVKTVLGQDFNFLPIVKDSCSTSGTHHLRPEPTFMLKCWPNPFTEQTQISYEADGTHTVIELLDYSGKVAATVEDRTPPIGKAHVNFSVPASLSAGQYILRLRSLNSMQSIFVQKM